MNTKDNTYDVIKRLVRVVKPLGFAVERSDWQGRYTDRGEPLSADWVVTLRYRFQVGGAKKRT